MNDSRRQIGNNGEDIALVFLVEKGYELVQRNYRVRSGELDLVMRDGDCLVFVEVRCKTRIAHGTPLETVNFAKRRQIERTARHYLHRYKIDESVHCRFDVIGIVMPANSPPVIEHIENAFNAGE